MKNKKKKAKLYYQDKIFELSKQGKSIREITEYINTQCLPRSIYKGITLSKSIIHIIIKKKEENGIYANKR